MRDKRAIKQALQPAAAAIMRVAVSHTASRRLVNRTYNHLSPRLRAIFYRWFAEIFQASKSRVDGGVWRTRFSGRQVLLPIRSENISLEWPAILGLMGYDYEVIETYGALIHSDRRPDFFIDIGANYGTHSLLFLVHDILTLSFEPNPHCHSYFFE